MASKENSNLRGKTIRGIIWRFAERVSAQLISFIVSIVLARLLLPSEYGVIAITTIFISIANVLTINGLGSSLVQKKDADELDFSTMFYAGLVFSLFLYLLLFLFSPLISISFHEPQVSDVLKVLGLTLPISAINNIQQAFVSRKMEFKKFFYANLTGTLFSGVVGISAAFYGFGVWALVIQQISNSLVNTFTMNRIIAWRPKIEFSFERFRQLFSFGYKIMLSGVIGAIFNQLKGFVIGIKYKPQDLAFYNRGESIPSIIGSNVSNSIDSVLFSALSKVQGDKDRLKKGLRRSMLTSSYLVCPLMFGLSAIANKLIPVLLTDKWNPAIPFMQILSLSYSFMILSTSNLQAIKAIGRSDINLKLEIYKKPFFILLLIIGLQFGPIGIAVSLTCYDFLVLIINMQPNKKLINYGYFEQWKDLLPNFISAILMGAIIYGIGLLLHNPYISLLVQITSGVILYIVFSILFKLESFFFLRDLMINHLKNR